MKPVQTNASTTRSRPMVLFQGGFETKPNDTVKILRMEQESLNRRLPGDFSEDIEEAQASILDDYFRNSFGASEAGFKLGLINNPYAIVATGSYGRKETCRNPSVSILFIFKNEIPKGVVGLIRDIVYPLWDLGFTINHSTKTLKDCINTASKDFSTLVSLMDSRFICGVSPLYSRLMNQLREKIVFNRRRDLLYFIFDRDTARHKEYSNTDQLIEPDLVYGPGGLMDYQSMLSAGRLAVGLMHPDEMGNKKLLSMSELKRLTESISFLKKILLLSRRDTRLKLKDQHVAAKSMGYINNGAGKAVDCFLTDLSYHMSTISMIRRQFYLNLVPEKYTGLPVLEGDIKTGTRWVTISRGMIRITSGLKLKKHPELLTAVFGVSEERKAPLSHETIRLVMENLALVNDEYIKNEAVMTLFEHALFLSSPGSDIPRLMTGSGLTGAFIPEFNLIMHKKRFSLYPEPPLHIRTLLTLSHLKSVITEKGGGLSDENRSALMWAGLLLHVFEYSAMNDPGITGTDLARNVLRRFLKTEKFIRKVGFLIENNELPGRIIHLQDLSKEDSIREMRKLAEAPGMMTMLYLLSLADLMSAHSGLNPYKIDDLRYLFEECAEKPRIGMQDSSDVKCRHFFHLKSIPEKGLRHVSISTPHYPGLLPIVLGVFSTFGMEIYDARIIMTKRENCRIFIRVKSPVDTMFENKKWSALEQSLDKWIGDRHFSYDVTPKSAGNTALDPSILARIMSRDPKIDIRSETDNGQIFIHVISNREPHLYLKCLNTLTTTTGLDILFYRKTFYQGSFNHIIHGRSTRIEALDTAAIKAVFHDVTR